MEPESKCIKYRIKEKNGYFYIQRLIREVTHPKWIKKFLGLMDYEEWGYCDEYNKIIPTHYKDIYAYKTTNLKEANEKKNQFKKPIKLYY